MKTTFHTPRWHHSSSRRSLNPLQRVYAKSCSPPTLQRWIQWLAGKGVKMLDLKVWSGLVWFSIDDLLKVFREKLWPDFLGRVSTIEGKTWFFLPIFWGAAWVWVDSCLGFSGFHYCGGHGICDRLGKSQRGELWSISQGRNFDHFLDLQGRGFDGHFSMILDFFWEVFGVVEGGICLTTNSYKLQTCFWMYCWL